MSDWQSWEEKLSGAGETEVDDFVDDLADRLLGSPPDRSATAVVIKAVETARSDLSVRSAVTALVYIAADDDAQAVEHLEQAFDARRENVFLASSLLSALGLLGLRNAAARAGSIRYLLRLCATDSQPLLLAGAKVIGLLCDREDAPALQKKLKEFAESNDVAVRAEARQQLALLKFADAWLAVSHTDLIASLTVARNAFKEAEESEEIRPDATLFRLLIDAVLLFEDLEFDREAAAVRIKEVAYQLRGMGGSLAKQIFRMYRSPVASQIANRCEVIASALESAAREVAQATRWTNFDKSVVLLAKCYAEIRDRPEIFGNERIVLAGSNMADRVLKPRLGPVLARKVGRDSFEQVIRDYEAEHGCDEVSNGLRALLQDALQAEKTGNHQLSEEKIGQLCAMATRAGWTPEQLVNKLYLYVTINDGGGVSIGLLSPPSRKRRTKCEPSGGKPPLEKSNPMKFQIYERIFREHQPRAKYLETVDRLKGDKDFVEQVREANLRLNTTLVRVALSFFDYRRRESKNQETHSV